MKQIQKQCTQRRLAAARLRRVAATICQTTTPDDEGENPPPKSERSRATLTCKAPAVVAPA